MRQTLYKWCVQTGDDTLLRQRNTEKNGDLTPDTVSHGSHYKAFWRCSAGHCWQAAVYTRTAGASCPYCAGKRVWQDGNDLATMHPGVAAERHPTKNASLTPSDVRPGTHRKVWWLCATGHEWQAEVKSRAHGCGCPYCAGRRVLPGFNDLATTEPAVAAQWYQPLNGGLTPETVTYGSSKRVFWKCSEGHVWKAVISSRAGKQKTGCPICAGKYSAKRRTRYDAIMARARAESPIQE